MSKFQPFWNMASEVTTPDVLNMYVYGRITASSHWLFGSDTDVVTSQFVKDLRKYPEAKRINVYINSPGGDVFAAAAIKNQLKAHPAEVHAYIDGLAASASVGLAMGADVIHMSNSALIMVHNPLTRVEGDVRELQKGIEVLQKVKTTIVAIYSEKTGLSDEKLAELMNEESWLTAQEALEYGFIDEIIEGSKLDVVNEDDQLMVNGVAFAFGDKFTMEGSRFAFCNNISKEKLMQKLAPIQNNQQGGNIMTFAELLNSLPAEQQAILNTHIQNEITTAQTTATEAANTANIEVVNGLQARIQELEDAAKPAVDPEEALMNNMTAEVKAAYVQAKTAAAEAQQALLNEQAASKKAAFKATLSVYDSIPLEESHIEALFALSNTSPEYFAQIESLLTVANTAMAAGFTAVGSDKGAEVGATATAELEQKIQAKRKEDSNLSYRDALNIIIAEDPELYGRYRNERG